ncbi:zinc finger protein 271-like isoform X1, partial [Tachysurus ichikawai]
MLGRRGRLAQSSFLVLLLHLRQKAQTMYLAAVFVNSGSALITSSIGNISRSRQCEKYIDGQSEMQSNWMRYVNCARNEEEQNLVAFQYRGGILYRCCQPIKPGQELMMWYKDDYGKNLGLVFDSLWKKKCSSKGSL